MGREAKETVLVVDDDDVVRRMLIETLIHAGFSVVEARGGREAIEMATARRPDAIVCDYCMPDLTGIQTIEHLRACPSVTDTPVLLISGVLKPEMESMLHVLGNTSFLAKPFQYDDFVQRVSAMLGRPEV